MKPLILLAVCTAPLLLSSCAVEHDVYYHHPRPYAPAPVVVVPGPPVGVVYYHDHRGRYYWGRHHRRVYVRVY